jgi:hypothetical protein
MNDDVEIEFPADVVDTVTDWLTSRDGSVGACLRCGARYFSQDDCDGHRCPQGRAGAAAGGRGGGSS